MKSKLGQLTTLALCATLLHTLPAQTHVASAATTQQAPTPITGAASYGAATPITAGTVYSSAHSTASAVKSHFVVDMQPGERVTVAMTSTTAWGTSGSGSLYFYLFDQNHVSYLTYKGISGPEQSNTITWMGNSSTPTRYFFVVEGLAATPAAPYVYTFELMRDSQTDAGEAGDAGESGATARTITQAVNSSVTYTGIIGHKDEDDYFRIPVAPGTQITVALNISDYGVATTAYSYIYDAANSSTYLGNYRTFTAPSVSAQSHNWMSNSSAPAAYVVRLELGSAGDGTKSMRYAFTVTLTQQIDAGSTGDAGDTFETAREITPATAANNNALGQSDKKDFYKLVLPEDLKPYNLIVAPPNWAGSTTGYLKIQKYDASRAVVGSPLYLQAPELKPLFIDMKGCNGCFILIEDQTSGNQTTQYALSVKAPISVYAPLVRK